MKSQSVLLLLGIFLLANCQKEAFDYLPFFSISTGLYSDDLDVLTLHATLKTIKQEEEEDGTLEVEYGFLYSSVNTDLSFENMMNVEVLKMQKRFANQTEESISLEVPDPQIGQRLFYRAFARNLTTGTSDGGARTVLGAIRELEVGRELRVNIGADLEISNDSVVLEGSIAGLLEFYGKSAVEHGHIYAKESENAEPQFGGNNVVAIRLGELQGDRSFKSFISGLELNTNYLAKAYIILDNGEEVYSRELHFRMKDGWRFHSNLPRGLNDAFAVVANNKAYLGTGCEGMCVFQTFNRDIYEFKPELGVDMSSLYNLELLGQAGITSLALKDTIYLLGGYTASFTNKRTTSNTFLKFFPDDAQSSTWEEANNTFSEETRRSDAIAFVINDKAYYGLGQRIEFDESAPDFCEFDRLELNDFYEFNSDKLGTNQPPWKRLADFPISKNENCEDLANIQTGRKEAVAFSLGNKGYVVTGFSDPYPLADLWEFDPEQNDGMGEWRCIGGFPGGIRRGASAFVLGEKAYVLTGVGFNNRYNNDVWSFDGQNWEKNAPFPGTPRKNAVAFSIGNKAYVAAGTYEYGINNLENLSDIWEYTPVEN